MYAVIDVRYEYTSLPLVKTSPNIFLYSEYDVTTVGISTGPLTVGPIIAAPACTGWPERYVLSTSFNVTPGEVVKLPMFIFSYKY